MELNEVNLGASFQVRISPHRDVYQGSVRADAQRYMSLEAQHPQCLAVPLMVVRKGSNLTRNSNSSGF